MRRSILPGTALLVASALLLVTAVPVAAVTIHGNGYYARWSLGASNPFRGMAVVDKVVGHSARLNTLAVGLEPGKESWVVGRSIGCNGTPSAANLVFRVNKNADAGGVLSISRDITFRDVPNIWVRSISFRTEDATPFLCVNSRAYQVATGDVNGDGAAGVMDGTSNTMMAVVEKRPNGHARLSIVVDPNDPTGDTYSVTLANKACGQTPTKTFKVQLDGAGYSVHDIHMNQGSLNALRSVRVRNISEGVNVGCAPLSIIVANTDGEWH